MNSRRMTSEERDPYPKKTTVWTEKMKERSLYSDRPCKWSRTPHRLGAIHKRLGKKVESNDEDDDAKNKTGEKSNNSMRQSTSAQNPCDGSLRARNPFRSVGSAYRSIATTHTTTETVASKSDWQSTADEEEKVPKTIPNAEVKVEMTSPIKSPDHHDNAADADAHSHSSSVGNSNKRSRDESWDSDSDGVTFVQTPIKKQKLDETSIDLGMQFIFLSLSLSCSPKFWFLFFE